MTNAVATKNKKNREQQVKKAVTKVVREYKTTLKLLAKE